MWDKIRRLLCRCKKIVVIQDYYFLEVCQCFKCEQYWLYNKNERRRRKLTREEAQNLLRFINKREE